MIKFFNSLILSVVCLMSGQLSLLHGSVICVAGDGCVSVVGQGHSHHCCQAEEVLACSCSGHGHETVENDGDNFVAADCTDIEVEFSSMQITSGVRVVIPQWYAETPRFFISEITTVYKAPIWCRQLVYPPPLLTHIRSTVILC